MLSRTEKLLWGADFMIGGIGWFFGGPYAGLACFAIGALLILFGLTENARPRWRRAMFDVVEKIHSALGIESTLAFVLIIALGAALIFGTIGGAVAWIVDRDYKHSPEYKAEHPDPKSKTATATVSSSASQDVAVHTSTQGVHNERSEHADSLNTKPPTINAIRSTQSKTKKPPRAQVHQQSPTPESTPAKDCPPGTAICVLGKDGTVSNVTATGFQNGLVDKGENDNFINILALAGKVSYYASSSTNTEEFIASWQAYHNKAWASLSQSDKEARLQKQTRIEARIRAVEGDPKAVEPLLFELMNE